MAEEEEQVAVSGEEEEQPVASSDDDWRTVIDDESLRGHTALEPIQSVENLAKAYVNASSMIGKDKIALPGAHSSNEDWEDVYDRIGRPENGEAYELEVAEGHDENMLAWFREAAHKAGLSQRQAENIFQSYNTLAESQVEEPLGEEEVKEMRKAVVTELRKEYGNAFEDRLGFANGVLTQLTGDLFEGDDTLSEIEMPNGLRLGDNPKFMKSMIRIGEYIREKIGEDDFEGFEKTSTAMTPSEARDQLREIEDPNGPLFDARHPQHDHFVSKRNELYENIYGAEAVA